MESFAPEVLVRWCQRTLPDDSRAFEALVAQYKQHVFAIAYRLMGNQQDAEDQAQEAFLKIYRGIKQIDEPATLPAWITRVTVNTCLDALNRQRRRPASIPLHRPGPEYDEDIQLSDPCAAMPEDVIMRREVQHCLQRTLQQMEPTARAILVLRDVENHSYQEIASTLALGMSAVKMRIHRARLAFQQILNVLCPEVGQAQQA